MNATPRLAGIPARVVHPDTGEVRPVRVLGWTPDTRDLSGPGKYEVEVDHGDHSHRHMVPDRFVDFDVDLSAEVLQ